MTLFSSRDYDPQHFSEVLRQLAVQINSDNGTSLLVSHHYDKQFIPAMLKRVVDAVNAHYSGSLISSQHYDDQFIAETLRRCVDKVNDGGGGEVWPPANAKIAIDLVNNRAWTEADGEVAIDTLLGTDPNTVNGWTETSYDAGNLTADGYASTGAVAFVGAAKAELLAGSTISIMTKAVDENSQLDFALVSTDGNDGISIGFTTGDNFGGGSYNGSVNPVIAGVVNHGIGSVNRFAATLTPSRLDVAMNGSAAGHFILDTDDYPLSGMDAALIDLNSGPTPATALQTITIYDALPDTTGLSALSATGVTNTAPSAITISQWDGGSDNTQPIYTVGQLSGYPHALGIVQPSSIHVADTEGNPAIITIVDDGGGLFEINTTDNPGNIQIVVNPVVPSPGTYNFTVRATDPGGLYVEQTFTITVTP